MEKEYGSEKEALGYSPGLLRVLSWEEQSAWDTRGRTQVGGGGGRGNNRNSVSQKSEENRKLRKRK